MRRDSIFYQLFRQYPALLFELISQPPNRAHEYIFVPALPIGLGLMVLTTLEGDDATTQARGLIDRAQGSRDIIDLISTIVVDFTAMADLAAWLAQ